MTSVNFEQRPSCHVISGIKKFSQIFFFFFFYKMKLPELPLDEFDQVWYCQVGRLLINRILMYNEEQRLIAFHLTFSCL